MANEEIVPVDKAGKNWVATMMLCWALGMYGAHRFYTGKTGSAWAMAIMSLTVCLLPISLVWQVVDGIVIALGNFKHADGSPLYERINWLGVVYIVLVVLGAIYLLINFAATMALIGGMLSGAGS